MLERIQRWFKPPVFPEDEHETKNAQILYALLANMLVFLFFAALGAIFVFVNKILASATIFTVLVWVLASYGLVLRERVLVASRLFVSGLWILFSLAILLTGRINTTFVSLQLAVTVMAGVLLGRRSAIFFTWLSVIFGLGLTALENTGYPLVHYFPVPPLAGWVIWALTFILILTPLNPTIQRYLQTQESLRESEEKFRTLLDWAYDWELWISPLGKMIYCSPACERVTGWTPADFLSNPDLKMQIVHPDHREMFSAHYQLVHDAKNGPSRIEYKITARDGSERWLEHVCRPLFGRHDRYLGRRVSNRDVTERKQMETALLDSEIKFRAIFENSIDAVGVSKEGEHVFVNPAYATLFGYENSSELIGKPILDLIAPASRDQIIQNIRRRALGEPVPTFYETRGLRKNGTSFDLEVHVSTFTLHGEMFTLVIERDITQRKESEKALRESEARNRAILNALPDLMFVQNRGGTYLDYHAANQSDLYTAPEKFLGKNMHEILPEELVIKFLASIEQAIMTGEMQILDYELNIAGQPRLFEARIMQQDTDKVVSMIRETTEHRQAEAALRRSEARYRLLAENMVDVVWIVNRENRFTYISPSIFQLRGLSPEEALQETVAQTMTPESFHIMHTIAEQRRQAESQGKTDFVGRFEIEQYCKDGTTVWVECITRSLYDEQGQRIGVLGVSRNITERKQAETRESEQRELAEALSDSAAALNSSLDFDEVMERILDNVGRVVPHDASNIMLLDAASDTLSIACHRGYVEHGAKTDEIERQYSLETMPILIEAARTGQALAIPDTQADPVWATYPATKWINSYITVPIQIQHTTVGFLNLDSEQTGFFEPDHAERLQAFADHVAIAVNNAKLYADMQKLAVTDALTGSYNRAFFETELTRMEFGREFPVSIVVADLDNMKATNDTLGHARGDELLKQTAQVLQGVFRASDIIARVGGDEFAILLPKTDSATTEQMLLRVRSKLTEHNVGQPNLPIRLSLGTSTAEKNGLMGAFTRADRNMYNDKAARKSAE